MPVDIRHDPDLGVVVVTAAGVISPDDFAAVLDAVTSSDDYPADVPVICDVGQVAFGAIDQDFVASVTHVAAEPLARRHGARTAYVCADDLGYGVLRMFTTSLDGLPSERCVFRSMEDALAWVRADHGAA